MREDYAEALEKMFPKGFVIVHVSPNETISYSYFNPEGVEQLEWVRKAISDLSDYDDYEDYEEGFNAEVN